MTTAKIDSLLMRLRQLGDRIPGLESAYPLSAPTFGDGSEEYVVSALETEIGVERLPDDLRRFYLRHAPVVAMDIFNGYHLYDAKNSLNVSRDDGIPERVIIGEDTLRVIPVAGDGGGNQFLISASGSRRGSVWKWSHEVIVGDDRTLNLAEAEWGLWQVGTSYTEFLERVSADWRAFIRDDRSWDYLSG